MTCGVALALVAWPATVHAHPFATSTIEARLDGQAVRARLRLDASSLHDLLGFDRDAPSHTHAALAAYLDDRLSLHADAAPCARGELSLLSYDRPGDDALVETSWHCPTAPSAALYIRSTLFADELTPHDVVTTVRLGRAVERYFLTSAHGEVSVDIAALRRAGGSEVSPGGGFRTATPPPGAFSTRPSPPATPVARPQPVTPAHFLAALALVAVPLLLARTLRARRAATR
jgi:hypothetical protein